MWPYGIITLSFLQHNNFFFSLLFRINQMIRARNNQRRWSGPAFFESCRLESDNFCWFHESVEKVVDWLRLGPEFIVSNYYSYCMKLKSAGDHKNELSHFVSYEKLASINSNKSNWAFQNYMSRLIAPVNHLDFLWNSSPYNKCIIRFAYRN